MKNKVFVGGLNWSTTEQELSDAFAGIGDITEAKVVRDRDTGKSRGFGFVSFADEAAANLAVEKLDGTSLAGRTLRVNIAEDRKPPRSGPGGGFQNRGGGGNRWD